MIVKMISNIITFPFRLGIKAIIRAKNTAFVYDDAKNISLYERVVRFLPFLGIIAGAVASVITYISFIINGGYSERSAIKDDMSFFGKNGSVNMFRILLIIAIVTFVIEYLMMFFSDSCHSLAVALPTCLYTNIVFFPLTIYILENAIGISGTIFIVYIVIEIIKFEKYCREKMLSRPNGIRMHQIDFIITKWLKMHGLHAESGRIRPNLKRRQKRKYTTKIFIIAFNYAL